jgi:hypothetical protein
MERVDAQMLWMTLPDFDTLIDCPLPKNLITWRRENNRKCSYVPYLPGMLKWNMLNRNKGFGISATSCYRKDEDNNKMRRR